MATQKSPVVVHKHTALMVCKSAATLEELLATLDLSELDVQRMGARAIIAPADQIQRLQEALQAQGMYPRVVGDAVLPSTQQE